eukprot:CCRYP_018679-RA/>CCRYP_018679-RA protein AED:0.28 eAED:0.28 QI:75/0/0.5/1/0/0/2/0/434
MDEEQGRNTFEEKEEPELIIEDGDAPLPTAQVVALYEEELDCVKCPQDGDPSIAKIKKPELIGEDDGNDAPVPFAQIAVEPLKEPCTTTASTSSTSLAQRASSSPSLVDQSPLVDGPTDQNIERLSATFNPIPILSPTVVIQDETSTPSLPEATMVNDFVVDAFPVRPSWCRSHLRHVIGVSIALVILVAAVSLFLPALTVNTTTREVPSASPLSRTKCFVDQYLLATALDQYINQTCNTDSECEVGKEYGWPINAWCVSNVRDMSGLFSSKNFSENISAWDVSSVTDMSFMFMFTEAFNGDLSNWDVSSVTDMSFMFNGADAFNRDLSSWNVSSVSDMSSMFTFAHDFNGDLSTWDVSSVTDMKMMFYFADVFNGNLSRWDVSSVTSMTVMFHHAYAFNGDLSSWNVSLVAEMSGMFLNASAFNVGMSASSLT